MKLVQREALTVRGLTVRTANHDETEPETARIGRLWQEFATVCGNSGLDFPQVYGVYSDYDSDMHGGFSVTAGLPGDFPHPSAREVEIPAGPYLCFAGSGPCPQTVIALWQEVWHYFSTEQSPARTYRCDFEEYTGRDSVAIFIGIKEDEEERA